MGEAKTKSEDARPRSRAPLRGCLILAGLVTASLVAPQTRALWLFQLARHSEGERRGWCIEQLAELDHHSAGPLVGLCVEECDAAFGPGIATGEAPLPDRLELPPTLEILAGRAGDSPKLRARLIRALKEGGPLVISALALMPSRHGAKTPAERRALVPALATRWRTAKDKRLLLGLARNLLVQDRPGGEAPLELLERPCRVGPPGPTDEPMDEAGRARRIIAALEVALGSRLVISPRARAADPSGFINPDVKNVHSALTALIDSNGFWARGQGNQIALYYTGHIYKPPSPMARDWLFLDDRLHIMTLAESEEHWNAWFRRALKEPAD